MEECPTCRNPIGASLKQLRDERDRLIPFVTKNSELQRQYRQKLDELDHRQEAIEARENSLKNKEEDLLSSEVALEELLNEAKRPEEEFKKLENENQRLKNELTNERINYKQQDAKRISEIEILKQKNDEYRRSIGEQRDKIKSLS
jgi:chromosome segregation ATPase